MVLQYMKRKQLQALCKKHGISANLPNREMAERLSLILEKNKKLVSQGDSTVKNSSKKVSERNSKVSTKVVKKDRFSPENEKIIYEVSAYKRGGRRCKIKPLLKKKIQVSENEVVSPPPTGRKRARRDVKNDNVEAKSNDESDATRGLVRRRLRNREVVVEKSGGDLVVSEKRWRGAKNVENEVSEGEGVAGKDAKPSGRITRSRAKFEGKASESGAVQTQFDKIQKGKGRNAMQKSGAPQKRRVGNEILAVDGAEQDKVSQQTKPSVTKDGDSDMLIGNSRIIEVSRRSTRSQAKIAVKVSEEEIVPLKEPSKDQCRYASRLESVVPKKRRVGTNAGDGAGQDKLLRKTEINVIKDGGSEMSIRNSRVVEVAKRSTRSQAKVAGKASAAGSKTEEETVQHKKPSKDISKSFASTRKSVVFKQDKAESDGLQEKKETRKRSRNTNINLEAASKFEAVVKPSKEIEEVKNVSVPSGPSRRTRRNMVAFTSSVSTVGELETHETVEGTRTRLRNSNTKLEAASRFEAIEEYSKKTEKVENVSVPSGSSRRTRRNTIMFSSSVSMDGELEARHTVQKTGKRTRNTNTNLEAASKFEAIVESSKKIEKAENVTVPSGPLRRTRRNSIMFTSSMLTDGELETDQTVPVEDVCVSKVNQRGSSQNASRNNSILANSKLDGIANGVGKGKQQKRRREQIIDEEISVSKCKPLAENPPRRSSRVASKGDFVEPAGPTVKVVGKKRHSRSRTPVIVESPSKSFPAPKEPLTEDARLGVGETARTKSNLDASCSKQVLESSNKKMAYKMKQHGSVEVSTVNSVIKEATNSTVNLEETSPADQSNKLNRKGDFGDFNRLELEVTEVNNKSSNVISPEITSPAVGFSPANQSDNLAEPSNIFAWEKTGEAEEPSIGKNINHGSDNADDHSYKDDRAYVQEHQTLVQLEDAEETVETTIQDALFKENQNELSERSSEKIFKIPLEKDEEISVINPFDEQGSSHIENFLEAVEMLEIVTKSNLVIGESSALSTAEMQLSTNGGNATEATPSRPALETQEAYNTESQNVDETAETPIQEALEENRNELGERSSEKRFKIPLEKAEEINKINPSDEQGSFHTENLIEVVEIQEIAAESNIGESSALMTAEMQLSTNGGNAIEATAARPALETEAMEGFDNEVNNGPDHTFIANNVDRKEEAYNAEVAQNAEEAAETTIQEAILEENRNELGERSSLEKRFKVNSSDEQGSSHTENFLEVVEMQEIAAESNLVGESRALIMTAEMQLSSIGVSMESDTTDAKDIGEFSALIMTAEMQWSSIGVGMESDTPDAKDIDGKGYNRESYVMEENADCVLEVEFGDKNELEGMAPQVNDAAGASLREVIDKESEFYDDKRVEIMISPNECIERVDMSKMEESNSKNGISAVVVMDVDNGGTSVRVSPGIPGKPIGEKFTEINDTAPGALNEEKSMEVLGPVQHVDDLKDYKEENVLELERNCFVTSDSFMSRNDTDFIMAGDLNLNIISSDDVNEDNIENDIEVEFHKAGDTDHNVLLDGDTTDSERVEDGTKLAQKTLIFSQTMEDRSKSSMENSAKPEMGSNTAAVSHSHDEIQIEDSSNNAGGEMVDDEDRPEL